VLIYFARRQARRNKGLVTAIIVIWMISAGTQRFVIPYIFNNVLECYQSTRIYSMVGRDYNCSDNVKSLKKQQAGNEKDPRKQNE